MTDINTNRFFYVSEDIATNPVEEGECKKDRWWLVHPDKGLAFTAKLRGQDKSDTPVGMCNVNENEAKRFIYHFYSTSDYANHIFKFFPAVYMAHAVQEMKRLQAADDS